MALFRCSVVMRLCPWRLVASYLMSHVQVMQVRGHLERNGERVAGPALFGRWDEAMYVELPGGQQRMLWQKNPPPPEPTRCAQLFHTPLWRSCLRKCLRTARGGQLRVSSWHRHLPECRLASSALQERHNFLGGFKRGGTVAAAGKAPGAC